MKDITAYSQAITLGLLIGTASLTSCTTTDTQSTTTTTGSSMVDNNGYLTTPSGLKYKKLRQTSGKFASKTSTVTVHYEGKLTNGVIFDSSYPRGEPSTFPLNMVIKGWTEGLQLMKEGEKFEFYIPSNLAYGKRGNHGIPPNSPLIFTVELIKVN